ncbi:hypothetical protein [Bacteroides sp.]|uniref:hypothetical protein n=1 Tax=Bacteroides sp. TaxID=29523 RepID=UPI0025C36CBF|nr:hypothetical protein [Bacteroides sp.]
MRNYNKIALACCSAAFGLFALTGCEGGEIFEVNAPDWISDKVQEIEDSNKQEEEVLEGMMEDVYTIGKTDYSSGWWSAFSKYYVIPDGQKWNAVFNLNINPSAPNTYKNFALIISADDNREGSGYKEYGAIRFDNQPSGNSEWGDYIDRSYIQSTLTFETDTDAGVEKLGGKVTLTVDRTNPEAFSITMTNGTVTKTYKQPYTLVDLNADANNKNIRCFMVPEGSYIDFLQTNIEPIGGCTSAADKNPVSMVLQNVPAQVNLGTSLEDAMAGAAALVTFEEGVTKTVTASELSFSAIPDMNTAGEKTLVAVYNKTFKGENCDTPIMANAKFEVVESIESIEVTTQPSRTTYYYYISEATETLTNRTLAFDPTGMVVTATESTGKLRVLDNSKLTFSAVPATVGIHKVTITADEGVTAEVSITVKESQVSPISYTGTVGAIDNSTVFWGDFSDDFNVPVGETRSVEFVNNSSLANNWNNFLVVLRMTDYTEYAVVRADNYGWGDGYAACVTSGGQADWATWLAGMNGAKVTVYVTNCGNSTADIQAVMIGSTGTTSIQYYLGINTVNPDDLNFALSVDGCHLVFE